MVFASSLPIDLAPVPTEKPANDVPPAPEAAEAAEPTVEAVPVPEAPEPVTEALEPLLDRIPESATVEPEQLDKPKKRRGRPSLGAGDSVKLTCLFSPEDYARLAGAVERSGMSRSEYIRRVVMSAVSASGEEQAA